MQEDLAPMRGYDDDSIFRSPHNRDVRANRLHDTPDGTHHLEHFVADADEQERESPQRVLGHIDAGDREEAEHAIIELLESMAHEQHHHD